MPPIERPIICAGIFFSLRDEEGLTFIVAAQKDEDHQMATDLVNIRLSAPDLVPDEDLFPTADSYLDHCWTLISPLLCSYFDQEEVLRVPLPAILNDLDEVELPAEFRSLLGI